MNKNIIFQKISSNIDKPLVDKASENSPYALSASCLPNGNITASWNRQSQPDTVPFRVVLYDCTDASHRSECPTSAIVGSTELTNHNTLETPTFVAESLPSGSTQKVTSGGNYPGPYGRVYNAFQATKNRYYTMQLFTKDPTYRPVDGVATPQFVCSSGLSHPIILTSRPNPNPQGIEVACQTEGEASGAIWWTFVKDLAKPDPAFLYKAVAYDCTDDPSVDCSDDTKNFIAGESAYSSIEQIMNAQPLLDKSGKVLISRPGHKYAIQIFARNKSTLAIIVLNNASTEVTCR